MVWSPISHARYCSRQMAQLMFSQPFQDQLSFSFFRSFKPLHFFYLFNLIYPIIKLSNALQCVAICADFSCSADFAECFGSSDCVFASCVKLGAFLMIVTDCARTEEGVCALACRVQAEWFRCSAFPSFFKENDHFFGGHALVGIDLQCLY